MPRRALPLIGCLCLAASPVLSNPNFDGSRYGSGSSLRLKNIQTGTIKQIKGAAAASRSTGSPSNGRLINGWRLPPVGEGYRSIRQGRGRFYATEKMVKGLVWLGGYLKGLDPDTPDLAVGDLSQRGGGKISHHASHQNGRDVDLNYFWMDWTGEGIFAEDMVSLRVGKSSNYKNRKIMFDAARNWNLVQGLVSNPHMRVTHIFIDSSLRTALLNFAKSRGVEPATRKKAAALMQHWKNHANHMHVRIAP
jgi:penicillin-insensitive murein endopeptidase